MMRHALALLTFAAFTAAAQAQTYPTRPVQIVVPLAAGGAADSITRAVARRLSETWNQQVVVENKSGANTQIGASQVAKSAPDGYTLLASAETTFVVNPYLYSKLSYDPAKDFVAVTGLGLVNQLLLVHHSVPAKNVQELIALAKAKPGEVTFGTYGIGSAGHLNMEQLQVMAGVKMRPVHYRGGAPALTDLIGGHIDSLVISLAQASGPVQAGQIRALAAGSKQRLAQLPDLPTVSESGVPGYESVSYFGLVAPAGTPREIVMKINADVQRIVTDPVFKAEFLAKNHYEPILGSPEQFDAYMKADARKWSKIIKDANLTVE
ncbi:MAG TPA: tripartite tricarboxylate transporter substrate binding protein [Xanthobacteraceae bacterium]